MQNNSFQKIAVVSGLAIALSMSASLSQAGNAIGLTYASGVNEVLDWHEDHLYVDRSGLGLGISYRYIHEFESNLRLDVGASFFSTFGGDVDYHDLPLQVTIGYNFLKDASFKPYVRGGLSYHIMDGDYVESEADVGFLGALGVEIGSRVNFFAEVAIDTAEATFSTDASNAVWTRTRSREDIAVNDVMISMGVRF